MQQKVFVRQPDIFWKMKSQNKWTTNELVCLICNCCHGLRWHPPPRVPWFTLASTICLICMWPTSLNFLATTQEGSPIGGDTSHTHQLVNNQNKTVKIGYILDFRISVQQNTWLLIIWGQRSPNETICRQQLLTQTFWKWVNCNKWTK